MDFIRIAGAAAEGVIMASGPVMSPESQPDSALTKKPGMALKAAKPGTPEFREAIRQALMSEKEIAASQGVYNFTEKDRYGLDDRSRIILTVKDGKYVPAK